MFKNVSVPESSLPATIDANNSIKIHYKTNLLIPTLGPLEVAGFIWPMTRTIFDLAATKALLEELKRVKDTTGKPPVIINPGEPIERPGPVEIWWERFTRPIEEMARKEREQSISVASTASSARNTATKATPAPRKAPLSRTTRLLLAFTEPNVVIRDLFDKGLLVDNKNRLTNEELFKAPKMHVAILSKIAPNPDAFKEKELSAVESFVFLALRRTDPVTKLDLADEFQKNAAFKTNLCTYLMDKTFNKHLYGGAYTILVDETFSVTREWAFQRYETLAMGLGQPVLRGPVNATPVVPKSRLTISEYESKALFEEYSRTTQQGKKLGFSSTAISSERYQQALDNLSEYGISDETSFAQEATLRSTLSEQRRLTIDRISQEISSEIQAGYRSGTLEASSRSSEYVTEGKDQKLATTELKYQVVLPTKVKVLLNDISVAWCPRVSSPFLKLHGLVNDYEREQKGLFLAQSYVPLPVMPVIKVDTRSETFEVQIDGDKEIKTKDFERTFEFSDPETYIDLDGITANHRNGTSDDFNWDDMWNLDDLENARASLRNLRLSPDGKTLYGTAVLETTDPEWLNRSFITIKVPICSYTDETVSALQAYENAKQEHTMKLQAVNARASQYARLKQDELIEKYQNEFEIKKEAFRALIGRIFIDLDSRHHSYYEEVISRCIRWDEAQISFESQPLDQLPYHHLPPNHFMNCPAIRFFLPVYQAAEATFFEAIKAGGITYHEASAHKVRTYLNGYRGMIANWKHDNSVKLVLDEYDSELIIGHHLEAVLSAYDFSNQTA